MNGKGLELKLWEEEIWRLVIKLLLIHLQPSQSIRAILLRVLYIFIYSFVESIVEVENLRIDFLGFERLLNNEKSINYILNTRLW